MATLAIKKVESQQWAYLPGRLVAARPRMLQFARLQSRPALPLVRHQLLRLAMHRWTPASLAVGAAPQVAAPLVRAPQQVAVQDQPLAAR